MYSVLMDLEKYLANPAGFAAYLFGLVGAAVVFFLLVIPFHNLVKYYVIRKCGDKVGLTEGYFTMSPMVSFSPIGFFSTLILGFGFARPVYFDLHNFRRPGIHTCIVSLAGLITYFVSFLVSLFFYCLLRAINLFSITSFESLPLNAQWYVYVYYAFFVMLAYLRIYCIGSFLFNIIPFGPLDFSEILYMFLPVNWSDALRNNQSFTSVLLFVFAFLTIGKPGALIYDLTWGIIDPMRDAVMQLLGVG